jgi:hypothetical protein
MNYCKRVECSNYSLFLHTVIFSCRGKSADGILASWDETLLLYVLDRFDREIPSRLIRALDSNMFHILIIRLNTVARLE